MVFRKILYRQYMLCFLKKKQLLFSLWISLYNKNGGVKPHGSSVDFVQTTYALFSQKEAAVCGFHYLTRMKEELT